MYNNNKMLYRRRAMTTSGLSEKPTWKSLDHAQHRTTVLPPLGGSLRDITCPPMALRERTFFSKSHQGSPQHRTTSLYHSITEGHDYHWKLPAPRTQNDALDYRIVRHLRKKLNVRLEKRIMKMLEDENMAVEEDLKGLAEEVEPVEGEQTSDLPERSPSHENTSLDPENPSRSSRTKTPLERASTTVCDETTHLPDIHIRQKQTPETGPKSAMRKSAKQRRIGTSVAIENLPRELSNSSNTGVRPISAKTVGVVTDLKPEEPISPVEAYPLCVRLKVMERSEQVAETLAGHMAVKCSPQHKVINLYIQSGATDLESERTSLVSKAFPVLRTHCASWGYQLHICEPHWGSADMVWDDHSQSHDLLAMVNRAVQGNNDHLNFVTFLGQKYGEPILPSTIPEDEYNAIIGPLQEEVAAYKQKLEAQEAELSESSHTIEEDSVLGAVSQDEPASTPLQSAAGKRKNTFAMLVEQKAGSRSGSRGSISLTRPQMGSREGSVLDKLKKGASFIGKGAMGKGAVLTTEVQDLNLLRAWYALDRNAVPPVYKLQNISSQYGDILKADPRQRAQVKTLWLETKLKLHKALQKYGKQSINDTQALQKYCVSLSELELNQGLLTDTNPSLPDPALHGYWIQRSITELEQHVRDKASPDYMDIVPQEERMDKGLGQALVKLREHRLTKQLSFQNIRKYNVSWNYEGIVPQKSRGHLVYIERMTRDFKDMVIRQLDDYCQSHEHTGQGLIREVEQHVGFCQKRGPCVYGQTKVLTRIKQYIRSPTGLPLVVYGLTGSGQTSILAKAAMEASHWCRSGTKAHILVRIVGLSSETSNIRTLLRSICLQLCDIYNDDPAEVPYDFKGVFNNFAFRLSKATATKPIIVIIDGLNKLSEINDMKKLGWVPRELPSHSYLIMSMTSDHHPDMLKTIQKIFSTKQPQVFAEIPKLSLRDAMIMLEQWYHDANRTVTDEQHAVLRKSFEACPSPLYLYLIFQESLRWPSTMSASDVKLGSAVKNVVTVMLGRVEKAFGDALVRRCLGYITASKGGMARNELEDLLSLDDIAMDEVCAHNRLSLRRLPQILLLRILKAIDILLVETYTDGYVTLKWKYTQVHNASEERYLNNRDKAPSYHKALGEYFLDIWGERPKPFGSDERGVERQVTPQPLSWPKYNLDGEEVGTTYNIRRLSELPYHLLKSQQFDLLKKACLCNFDFVLAKITSVNLQALFEDMQMALSVEPGDMDLKLLSDTLKLSSVVLIRDPSQLPTQVLGRLHNIITKDIPKSHGDPRLYPVMQNFYKAASKGKVPTLIPSTTCLSPPGGILFDLLSGHTDAITAVVISSDGQKAVTTAKDDTLKVWELRTGRVSRTITGVGSNVMQIRLGMTNTVAITAETNCIRMWNIESGLKLKSIHCDDPASITTALDNTLLVVFFHGQTSMKCWRLEEDFKLTLDVDFEHENPDEPALGIHKDETTIVAHNANKHLILHAFKNSNYAMVRSVKDGRRILKLHCMHSGSVRAVAVSREYYLCAVRYKTSQELIQLEVFTHDTGEKHRVINGCVMDNITELFVNQIGSHAIAICHSEASHCSDIACWNIETEEHKHLAKHPKVSRFGACVDLRFVLTASEEDSILQIWNLSAKINQPTPKEKVKDGIEEIVPMLDNSRYVITKSLNNRLTSVWNVVNSKCAGQAVRTERSLTELTDVLLIRNTKAVILAEKGLSNVSDDDQYVFTTIHIYDLINKRYLLKIPNCYVFPSPIHEYVVLDDERLMGLSENRSHFIVWSLATGHIMCRIKSKFKLTDKNMGPQYGFISQDKDKDKDEEEVVVRRRATTAQLTPWQRRSETKSARKRRHEKEINEEKERIAAYKKEKENVIEQYLISKDYSTIVASFYAHHLCVFDIETCDHVQTLENPTSMLLLHVAALTDTGSHLVHPTYDDETKTSYVTLWNCKTGQVKKRLKNEKNVQAIAISNDTSYVVFGKANQELRIWQPAKHGTLRKIKGYQTLNFGVGSKIYIVDQNSKAIVYAGDISIWDLVDGSILTVFTPDMRIQDLTVTMDGELIAFGLKDSDDLVTLRYKSLEDKERLKPGEDVFGEPESSGDERMDGEEGEEEEEGY